MAVWTRRRRIWDGRRREGQAQAVAGLIFTATASNAVGNLVIARNGAITYLVTDGNATLNSVNVKSQITGATAKNAEILVADGASAYVLHAV